MSDTTLSDTDDYIRRRYSTRSRGWSDTVDLMEVEAGACSNNSRCIQGMLLSASILAGVIWFVTMTSS
jgi:hypothetical protein